MNRIRGRNRSLVDKTLVEVSLSRWSRRCRCRNGELSEKLASLEGNARHARNAVESIADFLGKI